MRSIAATGSQSRSTKSGFRCKGPHDESDVGFGSERHGINDRRLLNQRIKRSNHAVGSRS